MTDPPTTRMASPSYSSYTEPTSRPAAPSSGLSEDEARSFHSAFIGGFVFFTIIAAIAHFAVWQWRPWIPGSAGYPVAQAQQTAPATVVATNVQR